MPEKHSNATNLVAKYRPRSLAEMRGQPDAVASLRSFAAAAKEDSTPAAFVFHGPTGTGKTAAAWALAFDLGCPQENPDLGGVHQVPSGKQDGKGVEDLLRSLSLHPLFGSGWKVAIVNEADKMTDQAEGIWLDGLENLPPKTVVIFTTNEIGRLTDRVTSRCEVIEFSGTSDTFKRALKQMVRTVWRRETGRTPQKVPKNIGRFDLASGEYSIRLALQQMAPYVRQQKPLPDEFSVPFVREIANGACTSGSAAAKKAWETRRRRTGLVYGKAVDRV